MPNTDTADPIPQSFPIIALNVRISTLRRILLTTDVSVLVSVLQQLLVDELVLGMRNSS